MSVRRTLALLVAAAGLAPAYYHFVHYGSRSGPFAAVLEKFDLNVLPDKTVTFQIADNGPAILAGNDSLPGVVSQIRAAAKAWDGVETSQLRLRFGGMFTPDAETPSTPGIDVIFEELPPGVNGYGAPTSKGDIVASESGAFVAILRSQVVLSRDLTARPSWGEQFFLTAVHEFGHALGLQHSFTSGAMSTEITRATTKIRPISPDDVAGVSVLYPTEAFARDLGTITGRVAIGDAGVPMASVVAIAPRGAAISALTAPDGTFKIQGLPPGQYFVYAHPLPPAAYGETTPGNVVAPLDGTGKPFDFGPYFDTIFFPGSRTAFITVAVEAGKTSEQVNFAVVKRSAAPTIYGVQTYSFPAQKAVKPAHLYTTGGSRNFMVAAGAGLVESSKPASGLGIATLGGFATVSGSNIQPYSAAPGSYIQVNFTFGQFLQEGPGHLIFSRGTEIYILPYGMQLLERQAPKIDAIDNAGDGRTVTVTGQNLAADTVLRFDGFRAATRGLDDQGRLLATLPPASPGYRANVTVYNTDGQSSLFLQDPVAYLYEGSADTAVASGVTVNPSTLPAGSESLVELVTSGANLTPGAVTAGFSNSDVQVRKLWVTGADRALANVWVNAAAAGAVPSLTLTNGLRLIGQPAALQVNSPAVRPIQLALPAGVTALAPGAAATLAYTGTAESLTGATIRMGERPVVLTNYDAGAIAFFVPSDLPAGVTRFQLVLADGVTASLPLGIEILAPPAQVNSVFAGLNQIINEARPAHPGDILTVTLTGLPESISANGSSPKLAIQLGGIKHEAISVRALGGWVQFQFVVLNTVPTGNLVLEVVVEGTAKSTITLPVKGNN